MKHRTRLLVSVSLIFVATGCSSLESGHSPIPSTDVGLGANSPSASGLTSDERAMDAPSVVESVNETGAGPTTERVIGVVGLVTVMTVFAAVIYWSYKLATMMF